MEFSFAVKVRIAIAVKNSYGMVDNEVGFLMIDVVSL